MFSKCYSKGEMVCVWVDWTIIYCVIHADEIQCHPVFLFLFDSSLTTLGADALISKVHQVLPQKHIQMCESDSLLKLEG